MKSGPSREKVLGIAQAARILGMNHMTVGKLVRQDTIRGLKTENGHWVIPASEVIRYAAARGARPLEQREISGGNAPGEDRN
jgi:excisionase family DNA binding protein